MSMRAPTCAAPCGPCGAMLARRTPPGGAPVVCGRGHCIGPLTAFCTSPWSRLRAAKEPFTTVYGYPFASSQFEAKPLERLGSV